MDKKDLARMKRRVRTLQKQLGNLGPVMRGSVVVIGTRNKQPYFSLNKDKKTNEPRNTRPTTKSSLRSPRK
jgi:hypothetical protein